MTFRALFLSISVTLVLFLHLLNPVGGSYNYPIRPTSGHATNLAHPTWGGVNTPFSRVSPPDYPSVNEVPRSNTASPRSVSNAIAGAFGVGSGAPGETQHLTDLLTFWGQFMDHDLTFTLTNTNDTNLVFSMSGDPTFPANRTELVVTRSNCIIDGADNRQQLNSITAYVDGSMVYGVSDEVMSDLRTGSEGLFKTSEDGKGLPLWSEEAFPNVHVETFPGRDPSAFVAAGEARVNENPVLQSLHTLFVLEHNRYAVEYFDANPEADDEEIFQAARAWTVALIQHITYDEWLPALFPGSNAMSEYQGWDSSVDPTIMTEFATVAFRFGHTMLNPVILRVQANGDPVPEGHLLLRDSYFAPNRVHELEEGIAPILRGALIQCPARVDASFIDDVRNFLFPDVTRPSTHGDDLISLNIARGRDHGIPDYNSLREAFGLSRRETFFDIGGSTEIAIQLSQVYPSPSDVDPFIGALLEPSVEGSLFGELITTIVLRQFKSLRDGDPFWYEADGVLPPDALEAVKARTLGDVISDNTVIARDELPSLSVFSRAVEDDEQPLWVLLTSVGVLSGLGGLVIGWACLGLAQSRRVFRPENNPNGADSHRGGIENVEPSLVAIASPTSSSELVAEDTLEFVDGDLPPPPDDDDLMEPETPRVDAT